MRPTRVTNRQPSFVTRRQGRCATIPSNRSSDETGTAMAELVTDAELARARQDPAFRHQLLADNLERLLGELNKLRARGADRARAKQIREGVDLAVKLAGLLQRI